MVTEDVLPLNTKSFDFVGWFRNAGSFLIFCGAIIVVIGAILFWAVAIRKRRDNSSSYRRRIRIDHGHSSENNSSGDEHHGKRRRRKRRSAHPRYPQNPTLAETGGLPPIRKDPPPDSSGWIGN